MGVSQAAVPGFGAGSSSDALVSERAKVVEERDALIMQNQEVTLRLEGLERRDKMMREQLVRDEEMQQFAREVIRQERMEDELKRQRANRRLLTTCSRLFVRRVRLSLMHETRLICMQDMKSWLTWHTLQNEWLVSILSLLNELSFVSRRFSQLITTRQRMLSDRYDRRSNRSRH